MVVAVTAAGISIFAGEEGVGFPITLATDAVGAALAGIDVGLFTTVTPSGDFCRVGLADKVGGKLTRCDIFSFKINF
jgi:hypothetical protein